MSKFEEFLNMGGEFIIKKEKNRMLMIPTAIIDGKKYQCGHIFDSVGKLKEKLEFFGECAVNGLKRTMWQIKKVKGK